MKKIVRKLKKILLTFSFHKRNIYFGDIFIPPLLRSRFKELGLKSHSDIPEFWKENWQELTINATSHSSYRNEEFCSFEAKIRWHTEMGKECQKCLRIFIEQEYKKLINRTGLVFGRKNNEMYLDLEKFAFQWEGKRHNLDTFFDSCQYRSGWSRPKLGGVDLRGIQIPTIYLKNVDLSYADLESSRLDGGYFEQVCFTGSSLVNSNISGATFYKSVLDGSDVSDCLINNVTFNNSNVRSELIYREISYFQLVLQYLRSIACPNEFADKGRKNHTVFSYTHSDGLTSPYNSNTKRYIDWYEALFIRFSNFHRYNLSQKVLLSLSVIFTKSWTSFAALTSSGVLIILTYTCIYFFGANNLNGLSSNTDALSLFVSSFYFSVVTFTTLGFGEITPITSLFKLIVISEVILGYIVLGSFVFMIGHRANKGF